MKGVFPPTICSSQTPKAPINRNNEEMIENLRSVGGNVSNGSARNFQIPLKMRVIEK